MRPVEHVYVLSHGGDMWMARICVASIRRWHAEIPITVVLNDHGWKVSTSALEDAFQVRTMPVRPGRVGNSFAKLDLFTRPERERYLFLDADIVFLGPVLDVLDSMDEDFIVSPHRWATPVTGDYYDVDLMREFDPAFDPPDFAFNSGHYVATSGLITSEDLEPLIDFTRRPPRHRTKGLFWGCDQGLCNYLFAKKAQEGTLTLGTHRFSLWARSSEAAALDFDTILQGPGEPRLMHWAGATYPGARLEPRADILSWFQQQYYDAADLGPMARGLERLSGRVRWHTWRARKKIKSALRF